MRSAVESLACSLDQGGKALLPTLSLWGVFSHQLGPAWQDGSKPRALPAAVPGSLPLGSAEAAAEGPEQRASVAFRSFRLWSLPYGQALVLTGRESREGRL